MQAQEAEGKHDLERGLCSSGVQLLPFTTCIRPLVGRALHPKSLPVNTHLYVATGILPPTSTNAIQTFGNAINPSETACRGVRPIHEILRLSLSFTNNIRDLSSCKVRTIRILACEWNGNL